MPELIPFTRHRDARDLDAYWDAVIETAPIDPIRPETVDRTDALTVRRAQALAGAPEPGPAFADRLLASLLESIPESGQRTAGEGRPAPGPQPFPGPAGALALPRPTRWRPILLTAAAAIVLIASVAAWLALGRTLVPGPSPDPTELVQIDFDAIETTFVWQTGATAGFSPSICDVAVSNDRLVYVVDCLENNIKVFDADGALLDVWGSYGLEPGQFRFATPNQNLGGIDLDAEGNIYVFDTGNDRVQKFGPDHAFIMEWGKKGVGVGEFRDPLGAVDRERGLVYVADSSNSRVQVFDLDGTYLDQWGEQGDLNGQFRRPGAIAIGADDSVYVADWEAGRIQRFDPTGVYLGDLGVPGQLGSVTGLAVYPDGYVVAATGERQLLLFAPDGALLGNIPAVDDAGSLLGPRSLAIDADGKLYILESGDPYEFLPGVPDDEDTAPSRVVKIDIPDLDTP